ncbi:MAG: helix-turn-helix domain-containing protein [Lachnospiraceae bacterium]|nr:helix-turn-helix domain-containing protein [Lachnospiraceae bacterium]MBO5176748.1 helix-turn-helix domain-containing protein [Lachnospiraceae bacterium]
MQLRQIDMKKTGNKIKKLCKEKKITVKNIQKELGIGAFQSVYDWFSGKTLPSLDNLFYLSILLKVHMEDMIEVVSPPVVMDVCWLEKGKENKSYLTAYYIGLSKYMSTIQL